MILDYYKILGLPPSASIYEIKKAYRKLALEWHPDKNKNPNATNMFIKINEAYLILSDEEARDKYDKEYELYFNENLSDKNTDSFHDTELNNWKKTASFQANKYATMSYKQFKKLLGVVVMESSKQSITAIIFGLSSIFGASTIFTLFEGIRYGDKHQVILSIIFFGITILVFSYKPKKNQK